MRITWLLEDTSQIWGGVKVALEDANWLHRRGHRVTVLSRSVPPSWMRLECDFRQVRDFQPANLPDADVLIGTFWTTVPWAASAGPGKGVPVHYCQGYEGDAAENVALRDRIEAVYRLPDVHRITISGNLARLLRDRFGIAATQIVYAIDHDVHHPGPERAPGSPLRVGLVGPYQISWKDLRTGYEACRLAQAAGQQLVLVRATNTEPTPAELASSLPIEWHHKLPPSRMGDYYRSLDVFLGTSSGAQEGFFLPAIEAMACGVPTVLTDIPCFRSHGKGDGNDPYALFVPPADPAAMAEALVVAGRMADVRAGLRREGLAVAGRYTPDAHGRELEATLQQLVGGARTGTPATGTLRLVGAPAACPVGSDDTVGDDDERAAVDLLAGLRAEAERSRAAGRHVEATRFLAAAACLAPQDLELQCAAARARHDIGDHAGAVAIYDGLIAAGADDEQLHLGRGTALHVLGRYHDAAQAFRAAIAVGARTAEAFNRLGVVLFQAGDIPGARQSFERALVLEPNNSDAKANLSALPAA